MTRILTSIVCLVAMAACAPNLRGAESMELKVTRVAVFSSGVACFQCDAKVADSSAAELRFRTAQINDILKSLVVQDFDGGSISTVGYASQDPIEKTLKSFGVDVTGKPTLGQLLDQLRGEAVELVGPRALAGVILGVEKQRIQADKDTVIELDILNLLTEAGLHQLRISDLQGIKLTSPKVDAELRKALATLATAHDADKKGVVIHFDGKGQRRVRASYLLEAPIWKTSYRLVLTADQKPFLQGWATVENATEEDWNGVQLSLVSGRPISFTMDLYTPLYVPRPREELELYASLRPPQFEAGQEGRAGADLAVTAAGGQERMARLATKGARVRAAEAARPAAPAAAPAPEGAGKVALGDMAAGAVLVPAAENEGFDAFGLGRRGVQSIAQAREAGELFQYVIRDPVSIARQHSAMLPIVNQEIAAEKVSIFNPGTHPKYPLNGLILENTTDLNLMQGPVTVFDESVYAGDAKLPDLKPAEKRIVAYALDLATEVLTDRKPHPDELVSLRIAKGTLLHRHKYVDERTYNIKNKNDKDRTVLIEQPYSADWKLIEPKEAYERTQSLLRFKVPVAASKTVAHKVQLERVGEEAAMLADLGFDQIEIFLRAPVISPAVKEAIQKVVALRTELDRVGRQRAACEKQVEESTQEQGRVRENLKVLERAGDAYQRQVKKFDQLETQIEQLRGQLNELRQQEEQQRSALEKYLLALDVE